MASGVPLVTLLCKEPYGDGVQQHELHKLPPDERDSHPRHAVHRAHAAVWLERDVQLVVATGGAHAVRGEAGHRRKERGVGADAAEPGALEKCEAARAAAAVAELRGGMRVQVDDGGDECVVLEGNCVHGRRRGGGAAAVPHLCRHCGRQTLEVLHGQTRVGEGQRPQRAAGVHEREVRVHGARARPQRTRRRNLPTNHLHAHIPFRIVTLYHALVGWLAQEGRREHTLAPTTPSQLPCVTIRRPAPSTRM